MRNFKNPCSTITVIIATLILFQGVGWAKYVDRSGELPGMTSGGDMAKTFALVGGVAAGALITYYFIKKSRDKDHAKSATAERSWAVEDPRAVDPALVREAQETMIDDLVPGLPVWSLPAAVVPDSPGIYEVSSSPQAEAVNAR